uniref:TORC_N domain-containing protein n=1 Tax=Elaeophora elaphi TaxID=1147741 RepID=A0A0R3RL00_9BILA
MISSPFMPTDEFQPVFFKQQNKSGQPKFARLRKIHGQTPPERLRKISEKERAQFPLQLSNFKQAPFNFTNQLSVALKINTTGSHHHHHQLHLTTPATSHPSNENNFDLQRENLKSLIRNEFHSGVRTILINSSRDFTIASTVRDRSSIRRELSMEKKSQQHPPKHIIMLQNMKQNLAGHYGITGPIEDNTSTESLPSIATVRMLDSSLLQRSPSNTGSPVTKSVKNDPVSSLTESPPRSFPVVESTFDSSLSQNSPRNATSSVTQGDTVSSFTESLPSSFPAASTLDSSLSQSLPSSIGPPGFSPPNDEVIAQLNDAQNFLALAELMELKQHISRSDTN